MGGEPAEIVQPVVVAREGMEQQIAVGLVKGRSVARRGSHAFFVYFLV